MELSNGNTFVKVNMTKYEYSWPMCQCWYEVYNWMIDGQTVEVNQWLLRFLKELNFGEPPSPSKAYHANMGSARAPFKLRIPCKDFVCRWSNQIWWIKWAETICSVRSRASSETITCVWSGSWKCSGTDVDCSSWCAVHLVTVESTVYSLAGFTRNHILIFE